MTIQTDSFTEIIEALDFVPEIPCESYWCKTMGRGDHPAHWLVLNSCGCQRAICNDTRVEYLNRLALGATLQCATCDGHQVAVISETPIGGTK